VEPRQETEHKSFEEAEETRKFPNGRAEILKIGGGEVGRLVFEPGWRWSNDVKPIAQTASCEAPHFQYPSAASWRSGWTTGRSSWRVPATSPRCRVATMPGWWGTSRRGRGPVRGKQLRQKRLTAPPMPGLEGDSEAALGDEER